MNKKFVYQVGNKKKLYYDARPTKYQVYIYGGVFQSKENKSLQWVQQYILMQQNAVLIK